MDDCSAGSREAARRDKNGCMPREASLTEGPSECWSCHGEIGAGDLYCRHCGRRQVRGGAWYHEPILIILLALTVLGPFALPLIWKSPRMTRGVKWVLTIVLVVLTIVALWCLWFIVAMMLDRWREIGEVLEELR